LTQHKLCTITAIPPRPSMARIRHHSLCCRCHSLWHLWPVFGHVLRQRMASWASAQYMHSICMQHQVIWYAATAATYDTCVPHQQAIFRNCRVSSNQVLAGESDGVSDMEAAGGGIYMHAAQSNGGITQSDGGMTARGLATTSVDAVGGGGAMIFKDLRIEDSQVGAALSLGSSKEFHFPHSPS
jgi:hypothetical protein